MIARVDPARCTGHGRCYMLAPDLFDADDDGYSVGGDRPVPDGMEGRARIAAANCPESAIHLVLDEPDPTDPQSPTDTRKEKP